MRVNLEANERIDLVKNIFARVVPQYDFLNHFLSLGQDVFWRNATARRAKLFKTNRILDIACGTGDLAIALKNEHPDAYVTGIDFTFPMLEKADEKLASKKIQSISTACADALRLPFKDESFDSATIAFGIRNIPDRLKALQEMHRILQPGGNVLVLELTFPRVHMIRRFYDTYLNRLLPKLGGMVSGYGLAYQYLADSIMDFPDPEEFRMLLKQAGFVKAGFRKYTFGIATLHWAEKPL